MARPLDFETDGADWPHRDHSRFVQAGGVTWHVQEMAPDGAGREPAPVVLLLHGTGAATHSWRTLMPRLAADFRVIAVDLPGHGFTGRPPVHLYSLPGMALLTAKLIDTLGTPPDIVIGHSAGAAIAAQMVLDGRIGPRRLVSLAGALLPIAGARGSLFAISAKLFAMNPLTQRLFALRAHNPNVVRELLGRTGSRVDGEGLRCYSILARNAGHAGAALSMMASWNLQPLARSLPGLGTPLVMITGDRDGMIPASDARRVRDMVPGARWIPLRDLGHLAHEEDPDRVCGLIRQVVANDSHDAPDG